MFDRDTGAIIEKAEAQRAARDFSVWIPQPVVGVERTSASKKTRQITDRLPQHPWGRSSRSPKSVVSITAMSGVQPKRPARPPDIGALTSGTSLCVSSSMQRSNRRRRYVRREVNAPTSP